MSNEQDPDEEDSKDNALRRKVEEETALKTLRLTREKDSPFSIAMGDGSEITDKRPLKTADGKPENEIEKTSQNKSARLTIYQQARVNLMMDVFAVKVRSDGDLLEYFKNINGREISLFTLSANEDGLNAADAALKDAAADLQNLITLKFGINFQADRQPNFVELDALGEALSVSDPAHCSTSGEPLKVCFTDDHTGARAVMLTVTSGNGVEIHVRPDITKSGQSIHEIAREFVESLAEHTILKRNSFKFSNEANSSHLLSLFRLGVAERMTLLREHRTAYAEIKKIDQWEIDQQYGTQADGAAVKIRLPNGRLVNSKAATQSEVQRFEASAVS